MKKTIVDSFSEKLMGRTLIGPEICPLSHINIKLPELSKLVNYNSYHSGGKSPNSEIVPTPTPEPDLL